ncbi:GntR family transcriptional regulator [Rhodobacteraceae bacterium KMM 6894]|nr:GntR family transcriptional regulator [Rhodobacteraceae bacterium KMM 6894]
MDTRRADIIAAAIEEMIVSGTYHDGDRLNEHALAERFGVSRTPIREAFATLAHSGLVQQIPRRGVFVRHPGPVELMEMFEVMAELEAAAGRLAALRISDAALTRLRAANAACQAAVDTNDSEEYYIQNEQFHGMIYAQSGNNFLEAEALRLHHRLKPFRRLQLRLRGRLRQSMSEHEGILAALEAADPDGTAAALRGHVAVQGEKFHHLMANLKHAAE